MTRAQRSRRLLAAILASAAPAAWAAPAVAGEYPINACAVPGRESADKGPWVAHATGDIAFMSMPVIECGVAGGFGRSDASSMFDSYPFAGGFAGFRAEVPTGLPIELRRLQVSGRVGYTEAPDTFGYMATTLEPVERILCAAASCDVNSTLSFPTGTKSALLGVKCYGGGTCKTQKTYRQEWTWAILTAAESDVPDVAAGGGTLLSGGGQSGTRRLGYTAADAESGVARLRATIDGVVVAERRLSDDPAACRFDDWAACPTTTSGELDVDTTAVADGPHTVTLTAVDAAGNERSADAGTVTIDNVPAPQVADAPSIAGHAIAGETLTGDPGRFSGATAAAPLLRWKRCGDAGCEAIPGATGRTYTAGADDVGRRLVLEATAANAIGETTAADSAPTAAVATRSQDGSGGSGTGAGTSGAAAGAGVQGTPNGVGASGAARLTARFEVGQPTRRVRYGRSATVHGKLVDETGRPISGASVVVSARTRIVAAADRPLTTVVTNDRGEFAYHAPSGPSRELTFGYRAFSADRDFASTTRVTLLVRAAVGLRATPRALRNGGRVRFGGTVRGRPHTRNGLLVDLQVRVGRRWRSFLRGAVRTGRGGRFRASYRFRRTRRATTYRFRAVARQDSAYPYLAGRSRTVRVRVRP